MRRDTALHELARYIQSLKTWLENFEEKTRTTILLTYSEKSGMISEYQEEVEREMDTLKLLSKEATNLLQFSDDLSAEQIDHCQTIVKAFG